MDGSVGTADDAVHDFHWRHNMVAVENAGHGILLDLQEQQQNRHQELQHTGNARWEPDCYYLRSAPERLLLGFALDVRWSYLRDLTWAKSWDHAQPKLKQQPGSSCYVPSSLKPSRNDPPSASNAEVQQRFRTLSAKSQKYQQPGLRS